MLYMCSAWIIRFLKLFIKDMFYSFGISRLPQNPSFLSIHFSVNRNTLPNGPKEYFLARLFKNVYLAVFSWCSIFWVWGPFWIGLTIWPNLTKFDQIWAKSDNFAKSTWTCYVGCIKNTWSGYIMFKHFSTLKFFNTIIYTFFNTIFWKIFRKLEKNWC